MTATYQVTAQKTIDSDVIIIGDFVDEQSADRCVHDIYEDGEYDVISVSKNEWQYPYAEKATVVNEYTKKTFYFGKALNIIYGNNTFGFNNDVFQKINEQQFKNKEEEK